MSDCSFFSELINFYYVNLFSKTNGCILSWDHFLSLNYANITHGKYHEYHACVGL